jgi:hypothetical protein
MRFHALAVTIGAGLLSLALGPIAALAQGAPAGSSAAPAGCAARPGHDALDVMLGKWDVVAGSGRIVAHVVVSKRLDGCLVREEWSSPGGDAEGSYPFDARSGTWDEIWVTSDTSRTAGLVRAAVTRLDDGGLRFAGEDRTTDGKPYRHEVYLRPDGSNKLLQLMRVSIDGGATWQERFRATWSRTP